MYLWSFHYQTGILQEYLWQHIVTTHDRLTKNEYKTNITYQLVILFVLTISKINTARLILRYLSFVNEKIRSYAFDTLVIQCQLNSKTNHLNYKKFCQQLYITECDPQIAHVIFKGRTRVFDVKTNFKTKYQGILRCPSRKIYEESLGHIFVCPDGLICKFSDNVSGHLDNLTSLKDIGSLQRLG